MTTWVELTCRVPARDYAALEAVLEAAGALAITQSEGDSAIFAEPGCVNDSEWNAFTVQALFAADTAVAPLVAALREAIGHDTSITSTLIADQPWDEVWKAQWQPQLFAGGLCVCPTWCTPPRSATHVIYVDPGGAFGTGAHETTALCLDWLAGHAGLPGQRVIDYGCGSGILAVAAARLGALSVSAIDVDPEALAVARENVHINACEHIVTVGGADAATGSSDVLIANILLAPLIALAPHFADLLRAGGDIVLSGILSHQVPRILDVYGERFTMFAPRQRGEWSLLCGRRR